MIICKCIYNNINNLKFPPNKIVTESRFQGHAFELCFWYSHRYEWWIAKNLDSRSSRVFRPAKNGEFNRSIIETHFQLYMTYRRKHKTNYIGLLYFNSPSGTLMLQLFLSQRFIVRKDARRPKNKHRCCNSFTWFFFLTSR